jgi:hypothetical protein
MLEDAMRSMAQRYHTRTLPPEFFSLIAHGLAGKELPANQILELSVAIVEVFKSAGIGTDKFKESVERARRALVTLGLADGQAQTIAEYLRIIEKQVRGPKDMPVQRFQRI